MICILDFGSQYNQLIARRIREACVYCELHPYSINLDTLRAMQPEGIVLSGGPRSVNEPDAPRVPPELFEMGVPVLGICYGLQLMTQVLGGEVEPGQQREYGHAMLDLLRPSDPLFVGLDNPLQVWMSHGDRAKRLPQGFEVIGQSSNSPCAAIADHRRRLWGVQFHPEVAHTPLGGEMLRNFLFRICHCRPDWTMRSFVERTVERIRDQVGEGRALCAVSGGVDSSIAAVLVHRAIGERLVCVFVDNGVLRLHERERVRALFEDNLRIPLHVVDAANLFLARLAGVTDPERKRKIIGNTFIEVFEEQASLLQARGPIEFLVQGTLYPDVIESVSVKGPSATIKTHHNVGGLPEKMNLRLIEPLRELFKDEVRAVGRELGVPEEVIGRQPFPGPGLAVRILGEVTPERLDVLRQADAIVIQEMKASGWYNRVWQSFAVLLPVRSVGVMGDERTYENAIALRVVDSVDAMTADWVDLPHDLLRRISNRIINEVRGVNRVCYDVSSKPPSTIEWE